MAGLAAFSADKRAAAVITSVAELLALEASQRVRYVFRDRDEHIAYLNRLRWIWQSKCKNECVGIMTGASIISFH